jgi:hypothetical protein
MVGIHAGFEQRELDQVVLRATAADALALHDEQRERDERMIESLDRTGIQRERETAALKVRLACRRGTTWTRGDRTGLRTSEFSTRRVPENYTKTTFLSVTRPKQPLAFMTSCRNACCVLSWVVDVHRR